MNKFYGDTERAMGEGVLMRIYDTVKHTDISEEFILPDYLPDVKRIIRVDIKPKIDGKFISRGRVDYEGDVICHILFCDEGNHLKSVSFTASFSDGVDVSGIEDECIANLVPSPESVSCKMLNPRRVSIRLRLDTAVTVWCNRSFEPAFSGDYDEYSLEKSTQSVDVLKLICSGESGLNAIADLEADGSLPQINDIISCNADVSFYECKCSEGKALCRGDMSITVFYSSLDGDSEIYTVLFRKIPIAQVVLADGVDDTYSCMARGTVDAVKFSVSENGFGERRVVELDISYRIYLNCVGSETVTVVKDIYAPGKSVSCESEKQTFCKLSKIYSTSFGANLAVSREEMNMLHSIGVFTLSATPKIDEVEFIKEGSRLRVSGKCLTGVVVKNAEELETYEYEVPFKTELDAFGLGENFIYNYDIVCVSAKGRFDSETFYTELDMQLNLMLIETLELDVLKKVELSDSIAEENVPQMRFYYPCDGETLWDIGKRFGVSVNELREKNDIVGQTLPPVLFIPM